MTITPAQLAEHERGERLGRIVRAAWVRYCIATNHTSKPSHLAPWEELSEWDKEADCCIGVAVADAISAELAAALRVVEAAREYAASNEWSDWSKQHIKLVDAVREWEALSA